jgi:tetratricopeptide (TPR) repeat protein
MSDPTTTSPAVSRLPSVRRRRLALAATGLLVLGMLLLGGWWVWFRVPPLVVPGEALRDGDPEIVEAVQSARASVFRQPGSAAAWGKLGHLLFVHDFQDQALPCYARAAELDGRNPDWPYLCAAIRLVGEHPAEAVPDLRRAAERDGPDQMLRLPLAEALLDQGQLEESMKEFQRVLKVNPTSPRTHLGLAQAALARQDYAGCLSHLDAVGDIPFSRKQSCSLRLLAHQRLGDKPAVAREGDRLKTLPSDQPWPDPILEKVALCQLGVRGRANRAFRILGAGQTEEALSLFARTVKDYPDSELAWMVQGRAFTILGRFPEAEAALEHCLKLAPHLAEGWFTLGFVRLNRKNYPGALECFRTVIRLTPGHLGAHCRVGECLEAMGDRAGAIDSYQLALRHRPDYPEARERLAKLQGGK